MFQNHRKETSSLEAWRLVVGWRIVRVEQPDVDVATARQLVQDLRIRDEARGLSVSAQRCTIETETRSFGTDFLINCWT